MCWLGFSILIILGQITTASAQLQATQEVDPTLEQSVDKAFGSVVGVMASVLFWDVIFWDNAHPPVAQAQIPSATPLSDPLGWGLITAQPEGLKQFDFRGQLQNTYAQPDLKVNEAWIINQGRKILVKSSLGQAFIYTRRPAGQKSGEPIGPLELPEGSWSSFTELEGELLFGSSTGQVYRLILNPNDQSTEWKAKTWRLDQASQLITRRADGRYWLAVDQFGAGVVIERIKPKVKGQPVTDQEVMRFTPAKDWGGIPIAAGFDHRQIWIASNTSLSAWSAQDGKHTFIHSYSGLNSATPLKVTLPSAQDQKAYLLTSKSAPAQVITSKGTLLKISELISQAEDSDNPLMNKVNSATYLGSTLWVNTAKGAHQIATRGPHQFKVETRLAADQNPTKVSQIGAMMITQSAQSGLQIWRSDNLQVPLIVLWLVFGALFFTLRMRFVNLRLFRHAIDVVRGKYTNPNSVGEVSHFQALTSALSATVGLGNIAGVAIAVGIGGPGATFWMIVAGFLGMASKFTECTLGQKYRTVSESGEVMGGAMHYLSRGLKSERGLPKVGQGLAILFCILCVGASFGGGNAFQVKQSLEAVAEVVPFLAESQWVYGVVMAVAVGIVILGGIKSIAQTAEKIVPLMCGVYLLAALYVILANASEVPHAFDLIFSGAFSPDALYGGAVGVLVVGFKRAAFSNEAGIGSAAIAHAAAKTEYPVREGVVALLEPFIDTIVVCTMTALVIVITGAYQNPEYGALIANNKGAALTSQAMGEVISFFPYVLSVAVVLFAYSTMISWSYYGERCWSWLFGEDGALFSMGKYASLIYKMIFLVFAFLGSIVTATNILDFSDLMILGMALPNIYGLLLLTRGVRKDLDSYEEKLHAGAFPIYDDHSEQPAQDDSSGEA
jgi:AGCS family alanine or glycine:cation symporter